MLDENKLKIKAPYMATTKGVEVHVAPFFIPERSVVEQNLYFFAYAVMIVNRSRWALTLQRRFWIIRDGLKNEEIVDGEGVVGKTPFLDCGESFTYQSFCPLKTPTGNMRGHYLVQFHKKDENESLSPEKVEIPLFFLRTVDILNGPLGAYSSFSPPNLH